jgi:hypothetical protein
MDIKSPFQPLSGPNEYSASMQPSFTCSLANITEAFHGSDIAKVRASLSEGT